MARELTLHVKLVLLAGAIVSLADCRESLTATPAPSKVACPLSIEAAERNALVDVQAAALEWWIDRMEFLREVPWLFLGTDDGADLSDALISRLRLRYSTMVFRILPRSLATIDENGAAQHAANGEQGTALGVYHLEFSTASDATAWVECGGCGGADKIRVECGDGGWQVAEFLGSLAY